MQLGFDVAARRAAAFAGCWQHSCTDAPLNPSRMLQKVATVQGCVPTTSTSVAHLSLCVLPRAAVTSTPPTPAHTQAALGTCTEPTRWLGTDKWWSATIDITHLQAYMSPGLPTRLSMSNLLSNTYNVPLWGEATVQYFWAAADTPSPGSSSSEPPKPNLNPSQRGSTGSDSSSGSGRELLGEQEGAKTDTPTQSPEKTAAGGKGSSSSTAAAAAPKAPTAATSSSKASAVVPAAADVPHEVVPLVPSHDDIEAVSTVAGSGDRCAKLAGGEAGFLLLLSSSRMH